MNGDSALKLMGDQNVAMAIPMGAQFKTDPVLAQTMKNISALSSGVAENMAGAVDQLKNMTTDGLMSFHVTLADSDDIDEVGAGRKALLDVIKAADFHFASFEGRTWPLMPCWWILLSSWFDENGWW